MVGDNKELNPKSLITAEGLFLGVGIMIRLAEKPFEHMVC